MPHLYQLLGWKVDDPIEVLKNQIQDMKGKADLFVLLSHLGIHDDELIGHEFPEVDVVIGGHTHHIFHEGKMVDSTLLSLCREIWDVCRSYTLTIDQTTGKVIDKKAWLYDTNDLPACT